MVVTRMYLASTLSINSKVRHHWNDSERVVVSLGCTFAQLHQVTVTVPQDAPPGTILAVPIKGRAEGMGTDRLVDPSNSEQDDAIFTCTTWA